MGKKGNEKWGEAVGEAPPTILQKGNHTWLTNQNRKSAPE